MVSIISEDYDDEDDSDSDEKSKGSSPMAAGLKAYPGKTPLLTINYSP